MREPWSMGRSWWRKEPCLTSIFLKSWGLVPSIGSACFLNYSASNSGSARGVLLLTGALTTLLIYWMTRRIYRGPLEILPGIFFLVVSIPLWPGTNHHWDSDFFALLALAAFFLWQDRRRWWLLVMAGVIAGLTSCFLQQKGVLLILALVLVVWGNGYRTGASKASVASQLGFLLAGFAAVSVMVLLFFYASGGLPDLLYANLVWPLTSYREMNQVPYGFYLQDSYLNLYGHLLPLLSSSLLSRVLALLTWVPLFLIVCLPFLLLVLAGFSSLDPTHRGRLFSVVMLPYWAAGLALWLSELHRQDMFHLIYGSPLLLILLFVSSILLSPEDFLEYRAWALLLLVYFSWVVLIFSFPPAPIKKLPAGEE